jgi:hypothetical protein
MVKKFVTGSVTYAIKGKDLLKRKGYNAFVERKTENVALGGCGYAIVVKGNYLGAEEILRAASIKILEKQ